MKQSGKVSAVLIIMVLCVILAVVAIYPITSHKFNPDVHRGGIAIEKYLPANTLVFITFPDIAAARENFKKTNLYKLWHDEEIQSFLKPLWEAFDKSPQKKQWDEFQGKFKEGTGLSLSEAFDVLHAQVAIALIDAKPGLPQPFDAVISIDAGEYKDKLVATINRLQARLSKDQPRLKQETYEYKSVIITVFGDKASPIYYSWLDTMLVLTIHKERLEQIITGYQEKPQNTLVNDAFFRQVRGRTGGGKEAFFMYWNIREVLTRYADKIPPKGNEIIDTLGLRGITAFGGAVTIQPDGLFKQDLFIATSGERKGLTKIMTLREPTNKFLKFAPAGSLVYSRANIDLKAIWDEVVAMLHTVPAVTHNFDEAISAVENKIGFSIANDFLASLGKEMTSYSVIPEGGGLLPDSLTMVELSNQEKFEHCLQLFTNNHQVSVEEISFQGITIKSFRLPFKPPRSTGQKYGDPKSVPVCHCQIFYFIKDKTLFVSNTLHGAKRAILRMNSGGKGSLANDRTFQKLSQMVSHQPRFLYYIDLEHGFIPFYNTIVSAGQLFQEYLKPVAKGKWPDFLDFNRFPMGETIGKYLGQSFFAVSSDTEGIKIESYSTGGFDPFSLSFTAIVAAIAIPNLLSSRLSANEASAQASLKMLSSVEVIFRETDRDRNDQKDYWTADVSGLYRLVPPGSEKPLGLIDPALAGADAAPYLGGKEAKIGQGKLLPLLQTVPRAGYYLRAMKYDENHKRYQLDPDDDGYKLTNSNKFAFVAYPAQYGTTGKRTFIIKENGQVYAKDTGSDDNKIVLEWPRSDPTTAGWAGVE